MRLPAAVAGIAVLALGASPAAAPGQSPSDALAAKVLADMQSVHFERVVDFANGGGRIAHVPNVDVAVKLRGPVHRNSSRGRTFL